jgi:uncharacterized RDD family membrane protein YckC
MDEPHVEYAGFWIRVAAALIDTLLIVAVTLPLLLAIFGWDYLQGANLGSLGALIEFLISWVAPAIAVVVFWTYKQATPGKLAVSAKIVDARTGGPLSVGQSIGRYLAYFVSTLPLCLGLIWVAFDKKKQGWHDKLAGTVVIRERK